MQHRHGCEQLVVRHGLHVVVSGVVRAGWVESKVGLAADGSRSVSGRDYITLPNMD